MPDAGDLNARLDILNPPGDAIGLTHGGRVTLRVRYASERGDAIPGEPVKFTMIATGAGESTAGSVLSTDTAVSDDQGVARVDLTAGAQDTSFRVGVDARDAPTRYFYVNVSEGGFVKLFITPVHQGWRAEQDVSRIEVRLYKADLLRCPELDIDALPDSLLPPRSLSSFGGTVDYLNITAGQAHTLVAWAHVSDEQGMESATPVSAGCADLGSGQLPASQVNIELTVRDRALVLDRAPARARFDLSPVVAALEQEQQPWQVLGCESGPGQLLIDCTLDALVPDGALDCMATGTSALSMAVDAQRGAVDASGCRAAVRADTSPSLDAALTAAVRAGSSFPVDAELAAVVQDRAAIAAGFELDSALTLLGVDSILRHGLVTLRAIPDMDEPGRVHEIDLAATSRPIIEQSPVAASLSGNMLTVGPHGYTLRYGEFARDAFAALALAPRGLAAAQHTLGTALAQSITSASATGCAGLSEIVCTDVGAALDCLTVACDQGAAALDDLLTGWWRGLMSPGIDFTLSGNALVYDPDGDLVVDAVGRDSQGQSTGTWSATLQLSSGTSVPVNGAL